jgi:threonine dehydrogenase-like Zn-dependent dehydrogenase
MGSILGRRVVIIGQGPIGLSFTDFVSRAGARQVIVADKHDYRLDMAKRLGATHTINAAREDIVEAVAEYTKGAMADVTVEACGRPEAAHYVFETMRMQGTAIIFGLSHDDSTYAFNWSLLEDKLPRIIATNSARSGDMPDAVDAVVDLVSQGRLSVSHLLTHRMGWSDVDKAYETYSNKLDNSLKVVMKA